MKSNHSCEDGADLEIIELEKQRTNKFRIYSNWTPHANQIAKRAQLYQHHGPLTLWVLYT